MTAWRMSVLDGRPPHGWELDYVDEAKPGTWGSCDMCDARLRYEHYIHHPTRPDDRICVGYKCCELLMTEKAREKSKAQTKSLKARAKAEPEWFKRESWVPYTTRKGQAAFCYGKNTISKCSNGRWFWNTKKHGSGFADTGLDALRDAFAAIYGDRRAK